MIPEMTEKMTYKQPQNQETYEYESEDPPQGGRYGVERSEDLGLSKEQLEADGSMERLLQGMERKPFR